MSLSYGQIVKALDAAGVKYRIAGGEWSIPAMGRGWHEGTDVAAWIAAGMPAR